MKKEIKIANDLSEIAYLSEFANELFNKLSPLATATININPALAEAVANIFMHA